MTFQNKAVLLKLFFRFSVKVSNINTDNYFSISIKNQKSFIIIDL